MGDRCYMHVTVEKARAKEFALLLFGYEKEPDDEGENYISYEAFEVNWGGYTDRVEAAEKGILFYGSHGAGADYGPAAFYGADGQHNETPTGHNHGYVVFADEDGNIPQAAQDSLKHFVRELEKVKARIHNPLYALTQAASCT